MGKRRYLGVLVLGLALLALLLAAPGAALAIKAPGLASSSQYKAFVEYVKKLDGLVAQPTSAEQKNTYEAKLTAKKTAATHKANALFKRAGEEAQAEANGRPRNRSKGARQGRQDAGSAAPRNEPETRTHRGQLPRQIRTDHDRPPATAKPR